MNSNGNLNNSNISDEDQLNENETSKDIEEITEEYIPPKQTALPFITFEKGKFIISEEAKKLLSQKCNDNMGIISLVGKYRTGKSFLLNRVILDRKENLGFDVGPTIKPCTKGIWIWSDPLTIKNVHSPTPFPVYLIDTEGLGAYDEEINHDSKIFLIAILISSLFVYSSFGTIDDNQGIFNSIRKYGTGKSFLLSRVILNGTVNIGFNVGLTFNPYTKYIRTLI